MPEPLKEERRRWYDALISRANKGAKYTHIVCFTQGPVVGKINKDCLPQWRYQHCENMSQVKGFASGRVVLKKAKTIVDPDILVIGTKHAAIGISVRDPLTDELSRDGMLIFHNPPNAEIIAELRTTFEIIDRQSTGVLKVPED